MDIYYTMPDPVLLVQFFKALSHPSRLKLLGFLAQQERTVQELAQLLELTEPTTSHHLNLLRVLGLVDRRPEGSLHWYRLESAKLTEFARSILSPEQVRTWAEPGITQPELDRVVRNYLEPDGRLKEIPATRKKRWVVLGWLARQFDLDRRYPEVEVNQILQTRHWDSATLRRELVGHRMLARERGIYWRLPEGEWSKQPAG